MSRGFGATHGAGSTDNVATSLTVPNTVISFWCWVLADTAGSAGGNARAWDSAGAYGFKGTAGGALPDQFDFVHDFSVTQGIWNTTSSLLTAGVHSIGVSYDPSSSSNNPTMYFDGAKLTVGSGLSTGQAPSGTATAPGSLNIGNSAAGTRNWGGWVADFAVWNVILTDAEFFALGGGARPGKIRPSALKGWWPLDGLSSPEPDYSGAKNNGTVTGTLLQPGPPENMITRLGSRFEAFVAGAANPFATAGAPLIFM